MTSPIDFPRRLFADCSPRHHFTASMTLDFPQPLLPTIPEIPGPKCSAVLSGKDFCPEESKVCDALQRDPSLLLEPGNLKLLTLSQMMKQDPFERGADPLTPRTAAVIDEMLAKQE